MTTTPFRIGVLGTHSTGKTTLVQRIEMELRGQGVTVGRTGGFGRRAAEIGLPKMQRHTETSTEWIIATAIANEIEIGISAEVVLADRAVHDALAYYMAALEYRGEPVNSDAVERLRILVATQTPKYDLCIATRLDPEMPVATEHFYDPRYRALVDEHVHRLLAEDHVDHLVVGSSADEQRLVVQTAVEAALKAVGA
ncbi:AAA family ATPase [Streptomyces filamentosus]|uniref:AAA family ATPase n=1 Tax=Streptomyces filamentosus TaxID=67294 RepID=UPI001E57D645|nr:AAA family ATPase [Streptomyces filamentosus]